MHTPGKSACIPYHLEFTRSMCKKNWSTRDVNCWPRPSIPMQSVIHQYLLLLLFGWLVSQLVNNTYFLHQTKLVSIISQQYSFLTLDRQQPPVLTSRTACGCRRRGLAELVCMHALKKLIEMQVLWGFKSSETGEAV